MKKEEIRLTDEEKVILKNIDPKYKYIVRDKLYDRLCLYQTKPFKRELYFFPDEAPKPIKRMLYWFPEGAKFCDFCDFMAFNHLFKFIKWEDDEPTFIDDLVDRQ